MSKFSCNLLGVLFIAFLLSCLVLTAIGMEYRVNQAGAIWVIASIVVLVLDAVVTSCIASIERKIKDFRERP